MTPTTPSPIDDLEDRLAELLGTALEPAGAWARSRTPMARPGRRPWRALGAAAAGVAVLVGGLGVRAAVRDDAEDDGPVVIADEPTTTTSAPMTVAPPRLVVGPAATPFDHVAVTAHGDAFVALLTREGRRATVWSSADGVEWTEHTVDLGGRTFDHLASDGSTLLAVGVDRLHPERTPDAVRSDDGGATWSDARMPPPDLPSIDHSVSWVREVALTASDDGFLVTAPVHRWLDLEAVARDQTGAGLPADYRSAMSGTTVVVTPVGGAEPITLDVSGEDPRVSSLSPYVTNAVWTFDPEEGWDSVTGAFGVGGMPTGSAWGPAGYLVATQPWADADRPPSGTGGELGPTLWRSSDGRSWEQLAPMAGMLNVPEVAAGGDGRYLVLLDERRVATSTDLVDWRRGDDLPASTDGGTVVAGAAGFVVSGWWEVPRPSEPTVVVERDGRRLTMDRVAGRTTVVDLASGEELLRWDGLVVELPPQVFSVVGDEVRFHDVDTGAVVFAIPEDEMMAAVAAADEQAGPTEPSVAQTAVWSADGRSWDAEPIAGGMRGIVAVGADAVLFIPVVGDGGVVVPYVPPAG
jgi:hypothetical protein